jgi:hypothetical protein
MLHYTRTRVLHACSKRHRTPGKKEGKGANDANRASFAMLEHLKHDFGSTLFMFHNENVSRRFVFFIDQKLSKNQNKKFQDAG